MQTSNWWNALPRAGWKQFQQVDVGDDWFSVYKLPGDVYAIYEDGQWQEVISYLVIGSEKALLWDTGMGIGDIAACVNKLTALPVLVVNSHTHMDHVGGNWQFDEIYVYDSPEAVDRLTRGNDHDQVKSQVEASAVWKKFPPGFDPAAYVTVGKAPTGVLDEGDAIDLGGRLLEVIHTPGHSADSIMLIDEANGIIFTGDTYYPAPLYAFSRDSDLATYAASMRKVAALTAGLNLAWIYPSHNEPVQGTAILGRVADCLQQIHTGAKTDYVLSDRGLRLYEFEPDIKILTLNQD